MMLRGMLQVLRIKNGLAERGCVLAGLLLFVASKSDATPYTYFFFENAGPYFVDGTLYYDPSNPSASALPGSDFSVSGQGISDDFNIPVGSPVTFNPNQGIAVVDTGTIYASRPAGFSGYGIPLYDGLILRPGPLPDEQDYSDNLAVFMPNVPDPSGSGYWYGPGLPAVPDEAITGELLFGSLTLLAAAKLRFGTVSA